MKNYRKNFKSYFSDLAKLKPSPGGGSAICLSFCLSVALIEKAVNYSISTRLKTAKDKAKNKRLKSGLKILAGLRTKIYPYIDKDAVIFKKIMSSYGAKRLKFIKQSEGLIIETAKSALRVFSLAKAIESGIKKGIISDFFIGLELNKTVLFGCLANLEANKKMFARKNKNIAVLKKALRKWQRY